MRSSILHVTQATGGVETNLLLILRHLDSSRFESHLACPAGATTLIDQARAMGVQVFEVPMVRSVNPVIDGIGLVRLMSLVRRGRYAIVHGYSAKGGYLARLAARVSGTGKTVYHPQAFSYLSQRGVARSFFLRLERLAVPLTDMVIAASESERRRAIDEVHFPESRVVVVPNSVDFAELNGGSDGSDRTAPTVLTVGRFSYQKNPQMFVRVARRVADRLPEARFVMLGGGFAGPLEGRIRNMIKNAGLADRFGILPWGSKAEALQQMARCDVFVLTSRFEGMPNTLLEALMVGRPTVVTDVDGSRDAIDDGCGFVVPSDDDEAMAARILQLLANPEFARDMSQRAQVYVRQRFDIRVNAAALAASYERVMAG